MDFETVEMKDIRPADYLSKGFLTPEGEIREGINGMYSLAVAYHLKAEGVDPETIKTIVDRLVEVGGTHLKDDSSASDRLSPEVISAMDQISQSSEVQKSPTLTSLFKAAKPWLKDWKNFSAFVVHLQRITGQLALVSASPK